MFSTFLFIRDTQTFNQFIANGYCIASCSSKFDDEMVKEHILSCKEMDPKELDMYILGQLSALLPPPPARTTYRFRGNEICKPMFQFINSISAKKLKSLVQHFRANGNIPRQHGNAGKRPHNTTSEETMADLLLFLDNYAIEHGLNLPGRVAGHRDDRSIILPAHHTMVLVHKTYQNSCITNKEHMPVSYNKFCEVWKAFRPYLVTANPRSDLCFTCQENVNLIIKSSNENIEKKSLSLFQQEEHLKLAQKLLIFQRKLIVILTQT